MMIEQMIAVKMTLNNILVLQDVIQMIHGMKYMGKDWLNIELHFRREFFHYDINIVGQSYRKTVLIIIRIIIIVRDQLSVIYILLYISAKIIGARNFVVPERGDAGTGVGDKEFALIIINQPVQEVTGSLALLVGCVFAVVNVEEL